jgi:hypothetical protein
VASVSITNISSGMTLGRTFVAYGLFDSTIYYSDPSALVRCSFAIGGTTYSPVDYQQSFDSTGQYGWWQAGFQGVAPGQHGVLTANLHVPNPPPPAEATELTVTDDTLTVRVRAGGGGPAPAAAPAGKAAGVAPAGKVKSPFEVEGEYTPGPSDIVIAYMRKGGRGRGSSEDHTLTPHANKWKAKVRKNLGEVGTGYAVIAELQHNGQIIATAAILNAELEP